jgi:hypothetical protein
MTTVHPPDTATIAAADPVEAPPEIEIIDDPPELRTGQRIRRLEQRRRLLREEVMAVLVLLIALAATVAVLATQWLENSGGLH